MEGRPGRLQQLLSPALLRPPLHGSPEAKRSLLEEAWGPISVSATAQSKNEGALLRPFSVMLVARSCPILCDPMACSSPGSSVHGILQARILEWVAISSSRWSS